MHGWLARELSADHQAQPGILLVQPVIALIFLVLQRIAAHIHSKEIGQENRTGPSLAKFPLGLFPFIQYPR